MDWDKKRLNRQKPKDFPLTADDRGWVKWIKGKGTVRICGKLSIEEAFDTYQSRYKELFFDKPAEPVPGDRITVKQLAALFMARQQERLNTGRPRKLEPRTYNDYRLTIEAFMKSVGIGKQVGELRPGDFADFAKTIKGDSPYRMGLAVAYLSAFFNWGYDAGHIEASPRFGPDFVKPSREARDTHRGRTEKRFSGREVRKLWKHATVIQRAWIALGINCAFNNSDIAHLSRDAIDPKTGMIDFRRRKVGAARRLCPLRAETIIALAAYQRPTPADPTHGDLVFLTHFGRPWGREKQHFKEDGSLAKATPIDSLAPEFAELMKSAGVYRDGRGFSGLRTTFRTIADSLPDERAIDLITGHKSRTLSHISAQYVEHVDIARLKVVVDHVWQSVFGRRPERFFEALRKREASPNGRSKSSSSREPSPPRVVAAASSRPSKARGAKLHKSKGLKAKSASGRRSGSGRSASQRPRPRQS